MSMEICKLCNQDSTPWFHINGHICEDCYHNCRRIFKLESKWISVKDSLPERQLQGFRQYIVASFSPVREIYHVGVYDWRDNNFYDLAGEIVSMDDGYWIVTHWMPLPGAPK